MQKVVELNKIHGLLTIWEDRLTSPYDIFLKSEPEKRAKLYEKYKRGVINKEEVLEYINSNPLA